MKDNIKVCICSTCKAQKRCRHVPRKKLKRITSKKRRKIGENKVVNIYYS